MPLETRQHPRKRTRTGCINCSRRRRKCDETKPACTGCKHRGERCQWRLLGSFRDDNIRVLEPEHPSMNQPGVRTRSKSRFKILNVSSRSPREGRNLRPDTPAQAESAVQQRPRSWLNYSNDCDTDISQHQNQPSPEHHIPPDGPLQVSGQQQNHPPAQAPFTSSLSSHVSPSAPSPSHPYLQPSSESVVDEFTALRDFSGNPSHLFVPPNPAGPYPTIASPLFDHGVLSDPASFANDIFLPGSKYEALHTALRKRQLWTAHPDIPSRTSSPASLHDTSRLGGSEFELSPERETVLWQNYLNEICLWLDMFDNRRHFSSTFPQMAKSAPHLRYSMLALSARQIERQQHEKSQSESLSLYQRAIHLLLPELESKSTPVIASCVILCVLEMLSCNPKEWRRHLDGCAYLIQAAELNGFSGKEEQALFWCFARMDVCGGLISEEETIIPIHNWIPKDMDPDDASQLFLASHCDSALDTYANYTVYLCACTLGVLFGPAAHLTPPPPPSCVLCSRYMGSPYDDTGTTAGGSGWGNESYVRRWQRIFDKANQWYENRPSQMKPIFTFAAGAQGAGGREWPFPTVLYGNGAAISGNQLYHACCLLLLQCKPKTLSLARRPKSALWHARQICSISASNFHHGCWTNALQPLWLAGKVMSHHTEHAAVVETLMRIEHETGWASAWRIEDLKEFWGDEDDDVGTGVD